MSTLLNLDSYRHELFEQQQQQHQQQQLSSSPTYSVLSMESSASSTSASENNNHYSSNSPSSTSNMSPKSNTSETSSFNMADLNISSTPYLFPTSALGDDSQLPTFTYGHGNAMEQPRIELSVPHLVILEQPVDKFRFRYQSEMHGTHGSLMGVRTEKSKKTFPTVELRGFQGDAKIRCSLFQVDPNKRSAHSHNLVIKSGDIDLNDPHDIDVNAETGYVAMFQGMGIIHTAKKNIAEELCKKMKRQRNVEMNRELTLREEHQMQKEAAEMAKTMNLNQVCLCFQAFQVDSVSGRWTELCQPVYTNAINNMKSALTGELKICRLSSTVGSVDGGEEVFMFVEKVCKNNIKIRFYELDDFDQEVWTDEGVFSEADVHHQYAIAFRTPPYMNKDIEEPVEVYMQLFRPRDKCQSESVTFKYKPRPGATSSSRKRPRPSPVSSDIPTVVPNDAVPSPGPSRLPPLHQPFPMVQGHAAAPEGNTISKEFNTSGIIQEILNFNLPSACAGDISFTSGDFKEFVHCNSEDLHKLITEIGEAQELSKLETDSVTTVAQVDSEAARFEKALEQYLRENERAKDVEILKKILAIIQLFRRDYGKCRELISALWMTSNKQKSNILHMAIERQEVSIACKLANLLQDYQLLALLDLCNEKNESALHLAVSANLVEVVDVLLQLGATMTICDFRGNTVIHRAVVDGSLDSLDVLLSHCKRAGVRVDTTNDEGCTALHLAVMCRNLKITRLLLERGASQAQRDLKHGNNILHIAVESDSLDMVNYILENVDRRLGEEPNNAGYTPLQLANAKHIANSNNKLIVRELLRFNPAGLLEKEHLNEDDDEDVEPGECNTSSGSSSCESVLSSVNLGSNRVEVIRYLENHSSSEQGVELTVLKNVPYTPAIFEGNNNSSNLFEKKYLTRLCELLNRNNIWREVGTLLDFSAFLSIWEQSSNPSGMLLDYFEMQKMKLDQLASILQELDQKEAIQCIDEMICKQLN